ncbi:hypothetical protein [Polyangium jinanense]|uniref:Uncharacterized protein n=1 Tax=Polyangium jinanense TaxID=2829994 RepID=A0A9X3XCX4_9BACT|nr:hypothetical protein [Polyangium jinanense]MDC3961424.1 hypothetical protein [Polyangium jinanense]MDC3987025.1 hypothetical protein [Polyangium jinanense]
MALDLTTLSPDVRAAFIKDGERFGSEDTLDQANQTLNAYLTHGSKLAPFGFVAEDAAELKDARDALIEAGIGRVSKRTSKKVDTAAHAAAIRDGQAIRLRARSVLAGAKRALLLAGKVDAVQKIDVLLGLDSVASDDAEGLAKQLDALRTALKEPVVAEAAKTRGGPQAALDLESRAQALRDAAKSKAEPRGTPVETETLDLIDGIIVSLTRTAREAADAAARELGEPAIATAFELSALYKRHAKKKAEEPK